MNTTCLGSVVLRSVRRSRTKGDLGTVARRDFTPSAETVALKERWSEQIARMKTRWWLEHVEAEEEEVNGLFTYAVEGGVVNEVQAVDDHACVGVRTNDHLPQPH